ncbi:hypothetical protein BBP40_010018 [Aspergillus hancockii]|nr:hypothetical protein BBP40_010018 [Aspergillus hancockii]
MERYVAWDLERPVSIINADIDVDLPSSEEDIDVEEMGFLSSLVNGDQMQESRLGLFVAAIRLKHITSRIHTNVYRVDTGPEHLLSTVTPLMKALVDYEKGLPSLEPREEVFM